MPILYSGTGVLAMVIVTAIFFGAVLFAIGSVIVAPGILITILLCYVKIANTGQEGLVYRLYKKYLRY